MKHITSATATDKKKAGKTVIKDRKRRMQSRINYIRSNWLLYALLIMPVAYFITFKYVPMGGILVAFKDYNVFAGILDSPWNNFATFKDIFQRAEFYRVVRNTFILNGLDLLVGFPVPIILAILLNEIVYKKYKRVAQTILYMPYFLSWVIIGSIAVQIFSRDSGMINNLVIALGGEPLPFLTKINYWIPTYTFLGIWQSAGWNTIIYLAAVSGINSELYEAAVVDGAGRWSKIWHVTLPGIRSTIFILLTLNMGRIVAISFDRPFVIGNAMVMEYADVISTYVYRVGIQSFQYSTATAVGLFQSVIGMIFLLITNRIAKRCGEAGIW